MSFADKENVPPIGEGLFNAIQLVVPRGSVILELGSGEGSTVELKKAGYDVWSIEHNDRYVGTWNTIDRTIHAPLLPETKFYDMDIVKKKMPTNYSALLVDGPDTESRNQDFLGNGINFFKKDIFWFFDDWAGDQMSMGIKAIAKHTGRTLLTFRDYYKQYAVLLPEGL